MNVDNEGMQAARVERSMESARLGVALSGGGVRASLFALGALTYLVDSRECERVAEISSVSGGSITNAFVAQRCDFQRVTREEFDAIAAKLASAITSGLLSKRFVLATYGFLGSIVVMVAVITIFSWPLSLPLWPSIAAFVLFGILLLLRGVVLSYLFHRTLFGHSDLPTTLGDIRSSVTHVFCATDLNASMPVYFTNAGRYFYSPAWGRAELKAAAQIRVADAVRSSAAFPGGIPPMRMDMHDLEVDLTPLQAAKRWQQLVFRDVKEKPSILYLADGGIWNN